MILAGDIGGTKTNLALFGDGFSMRTEKSYPSREHAALEEIVRAFLAETGARPERAAFGIAGPVVAGRCRTTNLPWTVDSCELAKEIGLPSVGLLNDLEATAWGIAGLAPADLVTLNEGAAGAVGNRAVIAAGTGLGEAGLYWDGSRHLPFACEGGHTGFSPEDDLEIDLLRYLRAIHGRVSWERIVSGPGLHGIYSFLRDTGRAAESPGVAARMKVENPPAVISHCAFDGSDPLSVQALDMFVRLYGAETGNLALKMMAVGGVYVGGGIAPRILPSLQTGSFMDAYAAKGRMGPLVLSMPVRIILNDRTALIGAARFAAQS